MSSVRKMLVLFALIAALAGSPTVTHSDDEPECTKQGAGKLQLKKDDTTILGLTIGISSMKDVEAKLGKANVLPLHGSASASHTICYSSPTDGTILTFGTNGMGGFVDLVEFGIWSRDAKFPNTSECSQSTLVSKELSTPSGIKLGLNLGQLSSIVGKRVVRQSRVVHYQLWCRQKMTLNQIKGFKTANNWDVSENPYFDVGSFVDAHFTSARVTQISITKTESY